MKTPPQVVVIGSLNMDIVVEAKRPPLMGETVHGNQVHFIPGGKGANQAVASARLGAKTTMIGAVGADAFGTELLQALKQEGIDVEAVKAEADSHTGVASIVLSQGDNQIIVVAGANGQVTAADIDQHVDKIKQSDVVLLQLEIPLETVIYAAAKAKELGKTVVLNPAPARELPDELLSQVDVLIPNESELYLLAQADAKIELADAMQAMLQKGVSTVVTTLGSKGAAYLTAKGEQGLVASHRVQVVDTTGAGDSFNAGFSYALAGGAAVGEAVAFATKVAALAVTKLGAQAGMPTLAQVEEFIAE
ncbi:ribokinase [Brevibacillus centrosporus]|uniref:Ribokinase n=1 Tax=Brevibacillus centrosporus TaxID=54910 RepID=A0A1I4BEX1_9BACL|nr:ribokinase [Brevibacillus centrosporus]MEC2129745.1 ribokinase [Brevibacillus centrosporus]MED4907978.1 ribokinase [Brevibacillus centrosporus]RNB67193.1 ribokinase [Brevibacillus centrosporus]SFK66993.1 ribokinase [Brevibacillus centrosporus]GED32901.1 ribokinase [Brevibacillus centrosporus]